MCLPVRLDFAPTTLPSKEVSSPPPLAEIEVEIGTMLATYIKILLNKNIKQNSLRRI